MGSFSIWHLLTFWSSSVLFGGGKLSKIMGDLGAALRTSEEHKDGGRTRRTSTPRPKKTGDISSTAAELA
jgi:Sec-independent protein translocase protein TatA